MKTTTMHPTTHIYEPTDEYMKYYKKAAKRKFVPLDTSEYRSIKIMYHKALPKYNFKSRTQLHISKAFNGAGFTMCNKNFMFEKSEKYNLDVYDINSAYQAVLLKNVYVIGHKHKLYDFTNRNIAIDNFIKFYKDSKYIVYIEFRRLMPKYEECDYNIYQRQLRVKLYKDKVTQIGWLCDVDLNILLKLYNFEECKIHYMYKFLEIGELSKLKSFIKDKYIKLHSIKDKDIRKNYKIMLHIATYGKSAQMQRYDNNMRSKYVIVALYQAAYVRLRMVNLFIKYRKDIAYIDTDSIFIRSSKGPRIKVGDAIGDFKQQYKNVKVYINRIKAYVIYQKGKRIEFKWSGIQNPLNERQLKKIKNGDIVEIVEKRKKKKIKMKIYDKYLYGDEVDI